MVKISGSQFANFGKDLLCPVPSPNTKSISYNNLESPVIIAKMIGAARKKTCYSGTGIYFLQQDNDLSEDQNLFVILFYVILQ